jgi:hypothetical protein
MQKSLLFNLIKNMQMSEKRYFSIFANRHSAKQDNKYLTLFHIIDELKEEDNALIEKIYKKSNHNASFIASDKNYLFNSILKSLNEFHNSKTQSLIIKEYIISIEILFYKGLFNEALRTIKQAEKIAKEIDHLVLILEILTWKKRCVGYAFGIEKAFEVNKEIAHQTNLLNNFKEITLLYYDSYLLKLQYESKEKENIVLAYKIIFDNSLMKNVEMATSFTSKLYWYLIHIDYTFLTDEKEKEYQYLTILIKLMDSNSFYASENPLDYVSVYSRLLANPFHKKNKSFFKSLEYLRSFPFKKQLSFSKEMISQRIFIITSISELEWYIQFQKFDQLEERVDSIISDLKKIITFIEPFYLIQFYFLVSHCLFSIKNYNIALDFINIVLNEFKINDRPNYYKKIQFLNILVHFELNNFEHVNYLIQKRKRNKVKDNTKFETYILNSYTNMINANKKVKWEFDENKINEFDFIEKNIFSCIILKK